ncbi:MAG: DNA-processing protein DprA [Bdellovibrionota bacterium]
MKIPRKFLISSLCWRGLKTSFVKLSEAYQQAPDSLNAIDFAEVMRQVFAVPTAMSKRWYDEAAKEWVWISNNHIKISTIFDSDFPMAFSHLDNAPTLITYWGELNTADAPCVSVVGTRHPSRYSIEWMESELDAFFKVKKDLVVVSGGAHGVDQKAHFLALRNGRATVCLLPSGLAQIYPRDLINVKSEMLSTGGAIVSSLSPFAEMQKRFFLERNRYIANWSPLTFVVEAKRRSGTMITARWVKMLDRELAVLPCSPLVPGLGGLDLIIDGGALVIRDRYDLNQAFERSLVSCITRGLHGAGDEYQSPKIEC